MRLLAKLGGAWMSVALLFGCATTAPQQASVPPASAAEAEPLYSGPELPAVELTEEILGDLFIAEVAAQRGQYDVSVSKYRRLASQTRDPRLVERGTRIALFSRDYKSALELSKLWIELDPGSVDAGQILTTLQLKAGDYDAALMSLERVLAQTGGADKDRYLLMIRLLGREQDRTGALEVMTRFLERHPADAAGLFAYAQLSLRAGRLDEAERSVNELLVQRKDWTQAVILKARILQGTNRESEAVEYLAGVVDRNSNDLELRVAYGRLLVDVGREEDALAQFRKVLKAEPENDDILFAAGLVALRADKIDEARGYFYNLFERSVRLSETTYYLGRIAELQNDEVDAIRWYAKVSQGENYLNAQVRSALLQARQGDVDSARAHLHAAKARSPSQQLRLFLAEGEILREVGHYEEAMEVYNAALIEVPGNSELLYARAMVAERLGDLQTLEQDLLVILEREPDHVDALNSLGYTLADRTDRYDEAYTYVKRALELKPDSFYILDSMGWVHYRQGRLQEALDYLQRAMAMSNDAEIAAHLGEVLWVMGDHAAARDVWQKALEHTPESDSILNAIKRLDQ